MSDERNSRAGVPYRPAGPGCAYGWFCARCNKQRPMLGRRKRWLAGVRHWICAQCVREQA